MTIDEAIKYYSNVSNGEHKQLVEWLEELKKARERLKSNAIHSMAQNVIGLAEDDPECPNCGDDLDKWDEYSYCPSCGQALSWDYVEEVE